MAKGLITRDLRRLAFVLRPRSKQLSARLTGTAVVLVGRLAAALVSITFATGVVSNIARADQQSDAIALVERIHQTALKLGQGGSASDAATESQVIRAGFDGPSIGKTVLGPYWTSASTADRSAFVDALLDAVARGIADRLAGTASGAFVILSTQALANGDILVRSKFDRLVKQPVMVDWRLRRCQPGLCIGDLIVDGASVTVQQRDEAAQFLAANGGSVAKLTATLRENPVAVSR